MSGALSVRPEPLSGVTGLQAGLLTEPPAPALSPPPPLPAVDVPPPPLPETPPVATPPAALPAEAGKPPAPAPPLAMPATLLAPAPPLCAGLDWLGALLHDASPAPSSSKKAADPGR